MNYLFGQMTMYLASETYERDAAVVRVSNSEYGIQRRRQVDAKRSKKKRAAALLLFKKFPTHLTLTKVPSKVRRYLRNNKKCGE